MNPSTDRSALLQQAIEIALEILAGNIPPNEGCAKIGEINNALDWPKGLAPLGLLAHEQSGHAHIEITAENCIPDILEECRVLLSQQVGNS